MIWIPKVKRGEAVTGRLWNLMADAVHMRTPVAGINMRERHTTGGVVLTGNPAGSATPIIPSDFSLYDASTTDDGNTTLMVGIRNGLVNSQLPTGMTSGGQPPYTLTVTDAGMVWLVVSATMGGNPLVTSVTLDSGDTVPDDTPDTGSGGTYYLGLGDYGINDAQTALTFGSGQSGIGSQQFALCGNMAQWGPA